MKKLISLVILFIAIFLGGCSSQASSNEANHDIQGIVYGDKIFEIENKKQLDAELAVNSFSTEQNKVYMESKLSYNGETYDLQTNGKVYPSSNQITGGYLIDFSDTDKYTIKSVKIEENAPKELLLPINYNTLTEKNVIKMALVDNTSGELLYFEDELPNLFSVNQIKSLSQEMDLDHFKNKEAFEEKREQIATMESWFMPYLHSNG
ncbi:hypothetical protein [Gracilibacillus phocaeensis]|uniref:hypothetical protein n=1 Tax=Gracilibacillus phocaeensis TaxID=2042304 RepID=UPI00102F88D0|nr:hypothetical protein [Gracilibacillus phocaeensis]